MSKTKKEVNIARVIYDAYPHSDLLPIDPKQDCHSLDDLRAKVTGENIGDGLFRFIVVEIVEGGEGTVEGAIRVMERAKDDVEAVLHALQSAHTDYCKAAEYLAEQGRTIFVGPMNGGLWNGRVLDACIKSKKEGDKAAYEFLIRFGDQYTSTLSGDKQHQWRKAKNKAAKLAKATQITTPAADLLEACKVLTSYTTDLLYRLDNQVNISDVEEIQQAKDAIAKYNRVIANQS